MVFEPVLFFINKKKKVKSFFSSEIYKSGPDRSVELGEKDDIVGDDVAHISLFA